MVNYSPLERKDPNSKHGAQVREEKAKEEREIRDGDAGCAFRNKSGSSSLASASALAGDMRYVETWKEKCLPVIAAPRPSHHLFHFFCQHLQYCLLPKPNFAMVEMKLRLGLTRLVPPQ